MNWVIRCFLTSCFSISFWTFLRQMWCENSTLSDVKLRLFYVSFGESTYRLLQRRLCRRGTCSGRLQYADTELLSLLRFRICDFFRSSCFYIAFWHIVYHKPRFFASEPFIGVCREIRCELTHTVNSPGDLSFERFWFSDAESCCFCVLFLCNEGRLFCFSFILTSDCCGNIVL